jgi:DNA-binding winged helix-turn-helix (wHTH) protein
LETARFYKFGPFCLDTGNRSLTREGHTVAIQPRTYDVLLKLIENTGRTVTREDLMSIWGLNVAEGALNYQINQARKALGDDSNKPRYIKTFPKRGFQFIAIAIPLSEIGQHNQVVVPTPAEEGSTPELRGDDSTFEGALPMRRHRASQTRFAGHELYVIGACAIYAAYFGVALLVEIAYQFDRYGETGKWLALLYGALILFSSMWALSVGLNRTSSGMGHGLLFSVSVFVIAAVAVVIGACVFLPAEPITQANFQTYTAPAAYFKDFCYIVPLGLIFLVVPLHFVVGVERELRAQEGPLAINLLTGDKPSAAPSGTVYLRTWFLLLLLIGMASYSLPARRHLFDNLKPDPYMSLFQSLIHVRMILYFGLAILCVAWYHRALNELKREAWQARTEVRV